MRGSCAIILAQRLVDANTTTSGNPHVDDLERSVHGQPRASFKSVAPFIGRCLVYGVLYSFGFGLVFCILGFIVWNQTGWFPSFLFVTGIGVALGFLFGVSRVITVALGGKVDEPTGSELTQNVAEQIGTSVVPAARPILAIVKMFGLISKAKGGSGRGKRAVIGAVVLGVLAPIFVGYVMWITPQNFRDTTTSEIVGILVITCAVAGFIGALIGALSESK